MQKLAARHRDRVIDLLSERLTFERSSVRLYDAILGKMERSDDERVAEWLDDMREYRDQEKEHEEWIEAQIRALGGDAHAKSEKARLIEMESRGIEEVIQKERELPKLFHALLAAELVDNAGWELLSDLADEADDEEAKRELQERLRHEEEHLAMVRKVVETFAMEEVLGEMPAA